VLDNDKMEYLKKYLPSDKWEWGISQLKEGRPIQYIIGNVDFYGNIINVNENVLIPRFETELLVSKCVSYINRLFDGEVSIIDIGTGSGCIAISLAKLVVPSSVSAVDISYDALGVAKDNALKNNVVIDFQYSDVFSNVFGVYDVIISNPPYIRYDEDIMDIVKDNEPNIALYASDNGLYYYKEILSKCSRYLKEKFLICFEIGCDQGEDVKNLALKYLKDIHISVEKDYSLRDRFVFIWN
jgi:release factor glutamine methyltransferase